MSSSKVESEIYELGRKIAEVTNQFRDIVDTDSRKNPSIVSSPRITDIADSRETLICLLNDMLQKFRSPIRTLIDMTNTARIRLPVMRTIVHFDLVAKVPDEGSMYFTELANMLGVDESLLERLLRFAFSQGIFQEIIPSSGEVSRTELSKTIPLLAPWFDLTLSVVTILPDLFLPEALESSRDAHKSKTAVELAYKNFYEVTQSSSHLQLVQEGLNSLSLAQKACWWYHDSGLFRWEEQLKSVIVYIGGGNSYTAVEAAKKIPDLHFIVQDLEENRAEAERTRRAPKAGVVPDP